ncbi:response regulator [Brevibacillus sp. 179-C9.3 HS]|uniref:response regulator n=1 Tax=unclassified Brevibacillus TaxID=2684853 RepID=UPI00399F7F88
MNIKRVTIISAIVMFLACANILSFFEWTDQPVAKNGVLDLRGWEGVGKEVIKLKGEWEFYPYQLVEGPVEKRQVSPTYIRTPGNWREGLGNDHQAGSLGNGTYRLKILFDHDQNEMFGFRVPLIRSAHRLIVGQEEIGSLGVTSSDQAKSVAEVVPYVAFKEIHGQSVDVIVQVTNFDHGTSGGIIQSISMGTAEQINKEQQLISAFDFSIMVVYVLFSFYFGLIHFLDRQKGWIHLSLLFLFSTLVAGVNGTKWLLDVLPMLSFHYVVAVYWVGSIGVTVCLYMFVHSRHEKNGRGIVKAFVLAFCAIGAAVALFFPTPMATKILLLWNLVIVLIYLHVLVMLLRSIRRKEQGAWYDFLAICLFAFHAGLNLILLFGFSESEKWYFVQAMIFLIVASFLFLQQFFLAFRKSKQLSSEMQQMDGLKNEFMASISEQMTTPLNAMISIADARLHSDDRLAPDQIHDLRIVTSIGWSMRSLVNDLLDFSRLRNKDMVLQIRPIDLISVMEEVIERFHYLDFDESILFVNKITSGFPPILADEQRLNQILFSMIQYARKKTRNGQINIEAFHNGEFAEVQINMQGSGVTKENLAEIIALWSQDKPLYQTMPTDNAVMSLMLVRTLVEMHGGRVSVCKDASDSIIYLLSFPFAHRGHLEVSHAGLDIAATEYVPDVKGKENGSYRRQQLRWDEEMHDAEILIVDDDALNLSVLVKQLSLDQYRVTVARDGLEALELLGKRRNVDLVIIDRTLRGMSGLEVSRRIREHYSLFELPILLLTSGGYADHAITASQAGANDFLTKPIESAELRVRVRTLLQLKRSIGERIRMELAFLQAQIKPHFLFNTLNSIASLSKSEPDRMATLLTEFGHYLRESFRFENSEPLIPFERELLLVKSYLHIEKVRFEDWLTYDIELTCTTDFFIPPLTLQPLVENAIRHGIMQRAEGGHIGIRVYREGPEVRITIEDDGVGIDADFLKCIFEERPSGGIGIKNIERRLNQLFGHGLNITSEIGVGTKILIRLPLEGVAVVHENDHR